MSEENVEIVRRILSGWETGDFRSGLPFLDPEIAFETFMPDSSTDSARGLTELANFTRQWFAQWQNYRITIEDVNPVGKDTVLASVRQQATGRQSGVEVDAPGHTVWTLRHGKVVKLTLHYDRDEALEAAGLYE